MDGSGYASLFDGLFKATVFFVLLIILLSIGGCWACSAYFYKKGQQNPNKAMVEVVTTNTVITTNYVEKAK